MKILGLAAVLLLATLVPPPGHGAHRGWADSCCHRVPLPQLQPLRIIRSPQAPKLVRPVTGVLKRQL